jgi:hypothetical protein
MKPEFSRAPLYWLGLWLVGILVVVQMTVTVIGMLLNDWRTYPALALLSIGCYLVLQRQNARGAARQGGGTLERTPHNPAPHHGRGQSEMD